MITSFLNALGEKLAERWATTLALPGLLFVMLAAGGHSLGQRHALDWSLLAVRGSGLAARWDKHPALAILTVAAVLTVATGVGLAARAAGAAVERCWLITGPKWLVSPIVARRLRSWQEAQLRLDAATQASCESAAEYRRRRGRLAAERNDIALAPPSRATWIGDRFRVVGMRVDGEYGIDLTWAWPRLWLILPAGVRTEIASAGEAFTAAAARVGWGVLYLALGAVIWWPAAVIALVLGFGGWWAGRAAAEPLTSLIESAADLYLADMAKHLHVPAPDGQLTPADGRVISERLRKGT